MELYDIIFNLLLFLAGSLLGAVLGIMGGILCGYSNQVEICDLLIEAAKKEGDEKELKKNKFIKIVFLKRLKIVSILLGFVVVLLLALLTITALVLPSFYVPPESNNTCISQNITYTTNYYNVTVTEIRPENKFSIEELKHLMQKNSAPLYDYTTKQ